MFNSISKLVKKHFYSSREEAMQKADTCFAMNKLTEGQFADLTMLIDEYYPEEEVSE